MDAIVFHRQPLKSKNNLGRTMTYKIKSYDKRVGDQRHFGFDAVISKSNNKPEAQRKIEESLSELHSLTSGSWHFTDSYFVEKEGKPGKRKWEFGVHSNFGRGFRGWNKEVKVALDRIENGLRRRMDEAGVRETFCSSIGLAADVRQIPSARIFLPAPQSSHRLTASTATRSAPMIPGDNLFTTKSHQPRFEAEFGSRQRDRGGPIERPLKGNTRGEASSAFLSAGYSSRRGTKTDRNMPG